MTIKPVFEELEPRILMSATVMPETDDGMVVSAEAEQQSSENSAQVVTEIVFIDSNVENYESLIPELSRNVEIVIIDSDENGIDKITSVLDGREDISAIHIISHGSAGENPGRARSGRLRSCKIVTQIASTPL